MNPPLRQRIDNLRNEVPCDRDILLDFVVSLDKHRGMDVWECFREWVKHTYGTVIEEQS